MMFATPVIPAKAGIPSHKGAALLHETPAFAGVTELVARVTEVPHG